VKIRWDSLGFPNSKLEQKDGISWDFPTLSLNKKMGLARNIPGKSQ